MQVGLGSKEIDETQSARGLLLCDCYGGGYPHVLPKEIDDEEIDNSAQSSMVLCTFVLDSSRALVCPRRFVSCTD